MNLTEKQLQELEAIVLDIPTRYGVQILQFFNKAKQDNDAANAENTKTPVVPISTEAN